MMLSCLVIGAQSAQVEHWKSATSSAGLKLNLRFEKSEQDCQAYFNTPVDFIIYVLPENTIQTASLINCLEGNVDSAPVILAGINIGTRQFQQYEYLGVRDVFDPQDTERLLLILRRELQYLRLHNQLEKVQQQYYQAETRHRQLIDRADEAIAFLQDGMHMYANKAYMNLFGVDTLNELDGYSILDLIADDYQEDSKKFLNRMQDLETEEQIELDCVRFDESHFRGLLSFKSALFEGEACLQLELNNLEFEHRARQVAEQDPETGLKNRSYFSQDLRHLMARKDPEAKSVALLYVLVDDFDNIKYQQGLLNSEHILREIADILQQQIKTNMVPYRYGDHAFTIIIESNNMQLAKVAAETLIRLISQHQYKTLNDFLPPTLSIGISTIEKIPETSEAEALANELLEQAYLACREIHDNAGNGYIHWERLATSLQRKSDIPLIDDTTHIKESIQHALEHDRFRLLYQPMVSIRGHAGEYYAVLLRMLDNNNEEIRPQHFVRHAIALGMMRQIDHWVVKHAIEALAIQRHLGGRIIFYLQLSENAIDDDTLLMWIVDCLRQFNAKGSWLYFQFHLNDIKNHLSAAEKLINGLQKINCGIAVDGYDDSVSARKLLQKLPINSIRLSQSLRDEILHSPKASEHVQSLHGLRRNRQIHAIAHQVETEQEIALLWQTGISFLQGSFLHEPAQQLET